MIEDVRRLLNSRGVRIDVVDGICSQLAAMGARESALFYRLALGDTQTQAAKAVGIPQQTASWIVGEKFKNILDILVKSIS